MVFMSKIIIAGHPTLKKVAEPVTVFNKKLKYIIQDMKKTMYESNGVGLAASQIDLSIRVFVADDGETGFEAYINPVWEPIGEETDVDTEGCLSIPGYVGLVERYSAVRVKYQDVRGKKKQKEATGLLARCIQHETDHLNGILFIEKATALRKLEEHEPEQT